MATFSRSATLDWNGDVARGSGRVLAGSAAFDLPATFPRLAGEPTGATTPEELLAASHAVCFGIALRSVLAQHHGEAAPVTATLTADKGGGMIRLQSSHLAAVVEGLRGIEASALHDIALEAERPCTISTILRTAVAITVAVREG